MILKERELKASPQDFKELFGVTYLPETTFEHWETEAWVRKKCAAALKKQKIKPLALWLGKLHAKILEKPQTPDCTIYYINETIGYGVLTNQPLKQWHCIGEYAGVVRRRSLLFPDLNDYCFMYPREWVSWKALTIDSEKEGNFTRFINHSDTPNLESVGVFYNGFMRIVFRALRDIAAGEELSYDYGEVYWYHRNKVTYAN